MEGIGDSLGRHLGGLFGIGANCLTGIIRDIIDANFEEELIGPNSECLT